MSLAASRAVLRHSTFAVRRAGIRNVSSTTEQVTNRAKEQASSLQSKASEGLSRVTSSAGSALSKAGSAASGAVGKVGGRTGRLIGGIQSLIPHVTYYSKVALELGKLVAKERKMNFPDAATRQSYTQAFLHLVRNPSTLLQSTSSSTAQPTSALNRVRNMSTAQWAATGVVIAETIGFFSVGEMIGRFKVVGYRSSASAEHH